MLLILIIPFFGCVFSQDFIQEPNIIQVGEYTNLICVLNYTNYSKIFEHQTFIWYYNDENNNFRLIIDIYNNKIHYDVKIKKFNIFIIDNKIILQIKNMTKNDKKYDFVCQYKNKITHKIHMNIFTNLTDLKFFNPFSLENMKIEYFLDNTNLTQLTINFNKTFTIPKCFVKINNEFIYFKNITSTKIDYIYSQVNLSMKIENINNLKKMICTLLNQNFTIISNDDNIYIYNNLIIISSSSLIITIIILFLISIIILLIFIYFKKRKEILYSLINKIKT